jgi:hypothetical protein
VEVSKSVSGVKVFKVDDAKPGSLLARSCNIPAAFFTESINCCEAELLSCLSVQLMQHQRIQPFLGQFRI